MINLKQVHRPNQILWTDKFVFDIPGQIATIEKSKATVCQQHAKTLRIVRLVFFDRFEVGTTLPDLGCALLFANHSGIRRQDAETKDRVYGTVQEYA